MGPRDIKNDEVVLVRRDTGEKISVKRKGAAKKITELLELMHADLFKKAQDAASKLIAVPKDYAAFKKNITDRKVNYCAHCGDDACEGAIKEETAATTRNIPFGEAGEAKKGDKCIKCGKAAEYKVYFARAY